MQIGARYDESYWVMGDQFMQKYYTIYDHEKWRVGLIESNEDGYLSFRLRGGL